MNICQHNYVRLHNTLMSDFHNSKLNSIQSYRFTVFGNCKVTHLCLLQQRLHTISCTWMRQNFTSTNLQDCSVNLRHHRTIDLSKDGSYCCGAAGLMHQLTINSFLFEDKSTQIQKYKITFLIDHTIVKLANYFDAEM